MSSAKSLSLLALHVHEVAELHDQLGQLGNGFVCWPLATDSRLVRLGIHTFSLLDVVTAEMLVRATCITTGSHRSGRRSVGSSPPVGLPRS